MKNKIILLFISLFANFSYAEISTNHQIGNFESYYLENGLKVILLPFEHEEKLGIAVNVKGGIKNELPHEKGYSHILEHLLFKKTESFPNIKEFISKKSNNWNGVTSKDFTYYYQTFKNTDSNLNEFLKLESERLFNIQFTEFDLESEKKIILNELEVNNSLAKNQLFDATNKQIFQTHPYSNPTIGYSSTIKNATIDDIQNFYLRTYQPKNIFIVIYGNFNKNIVKNHINKYFSKIKNITTEPTKNIEESFLKQPTQTITFSKEKINLSNISWNSPNFLFDKNFISARILFLSSTLEPFGHIHKKYVLNESKINIKEILSIQPEIFNFLDYQPFVLIVSQKENPQYKEIIDNISNDVEDTDNFSEHAFNKMKKIINNDWVNIENSLDGLVNNFVAFERFGDWRLYFYFKEESEKANFKDGLTFFQKYINSNNRNIITIKNGEYDVNENERFFSSDYFNDLKKELNNIKLNQYDFKNQTNVKKIKNIEDLSIHIKEKLYQINNNKIVLNHLSEKTNGDFVYIKIDNKPMNVELDKKYRNSCMLNDNFIYYDNTSMSPQEIKEKMIDLNLKFNNDFFNFYIKVPKENLTHTFDLLFTLLNNPAFNNIKFEQAKNSLIERIKSNQQNPNVVVRDYVNQAFNLYPKNHILYPYSTKEFLEDVSKISIEDVKECHSSYKGYKNATITIIGDLSENEIDTQINKIMQIESKYEYSVLNDDKIKSSEQVLKEQQNNHKKIGPFNKSSSFFYGQTIAEIEQHSPDYYKLLFALNVFGDGPNSILFNQFREKDGSSYNIKANLVTKNTSNYSKIVLSGSLPLEKSDMKIKKLEEIWEDFTSNGINETQLNIFKEQFNNQMSLRVSDENQILTFQSNLFNRDVTINWMISLKNNINQLTLKDVNEAIHKYLRKKKLFMVYSY